MELSGATAADLEDTGRSVANQYMNFTLAIADDGVGLVVPLDKTTPWG
ncbi:hypothetical protein OG730_40905 [Streptomyces sp. NBC_01298]|nr:hypothetical protein OG730_40905 [Streptomyces sp. NBC_01298]